MLKNAFFTAIIVTLAISGCKKEPSESAHVQPGQPVEQAKPQLPPADQLGEKTTFEVTYRGITGKDNDLEASGGWGFGSRDERSSFTKAVKKKAVNDIIISSNPFLSNRQYTPIEYKDKEVLYAYFDLNADGKLSDDERLSPVDVSERSRRGDNTTVFMTPDFTVTNEQGQKTPFRVLLWVSFYDDRKEPNVTWSPMGVKGGVKLRRVAA